MLGIAAKDKHREIVEIMEAERSAANDRSLLGHRVLTLTQRAEEFHEVRLYINANKAVRLSFAGNPH